MTFALPDILVNSAGLGIYKMFKELSEEDWDTTFDVNVKGTFLTCKAVLPGMIERGRGLVINIASLAAITRGFNRGSCYGASKYAVRGFSRYLAVELRPVGIIVCCLDPGSTDSHFRGQPTGNPNWMKPEDVAAAALYVATQRDRVAVHEVAFSMLNEGW
jgi:3-oxoacyl-[acyl-carrier protein] reductase